MKQESASVLASDDVQIYILLQYINILLIFLILVSQCNNFFVEHAERHLPQLIFNKHLLQPEIVVQT